nr:MAG TPA: hypothetical protein [Caudoviricetes sp.]
MIYYIIPQFFRFVNTKIVIFRLKTTKKYVIFC